MFAILATVLSVATTLVKSLGIIGMAIQGLKVIGNALLGLGKMLGLIKQETTVEEIGDKALQAADEGITPKNFDSFEDYVKAIDNFEVDPKKSKLTTAEQKTIRGIELGASLLTEKYPQLPLKDFCIFISKNGDYFKKPDKTAAFFELATKDQKSFTEVVKYMTGAEKNDAKINSAISTIMNIEKSINPKLSDKAALIIASDIRK
ncbi:MAG: hypothetical protein ACRC5H_01880 [Treponemataceae bacterium]